MRSWMQRLCPSPWALRKLGMLGVLVGVGVAAFCWGRHGAAPRADAGVADVVTTARVMPVAAAADPVAAGDYSRRVVAYLYNNVAITREELGEYLIARLGAERLNLLVERKIVELEGAKHGVTVSDAEVDAQLKEDLRGANLSEQDFGKLLWQKGRKTLYEWREDVIRPKLMMAKLIRPTVQVTEKDLQEAFEARFGPKVQCRMIVLPHDTVQGGDRHAVKMWEEVRAGREAFLAKASQQAISALAAKGGEVPPIHKHFGDKRLEDAAFRLKEGEISSLIQMQDGSHVILLCEKHLDRDPTRRLETERVKLHEEMKEFKLAQAIPVAFQQLRQQANPKLLLNRDAAQMPPAAAGPVGTVPAVAADVPAPPAPVPAPPAPDRRRAPSGN